MAVPVALKAFVGIVLPFQSEELRKLGVTGLELLAGRKTVIRQVVAPSVLDPQVDEATERPAGLLQPLAAVDSVEVEDDTRIRRSGPSQKTLVVSLDQANRPIGHFNLPIAEFPSDVRHEGAEMGPGHIDLGNDLGCSFLRAELLVEPPMVVVDVEAELVRVRPVELPRRG